MELDRLLKEILDFDAPFGRKVMILEGDFQQVFPVFQMGQIHN